MRKIAFALVALIGLALAGCDDQSATGSATVTPPNYNVTLYSGNEAVGNWMGSSFHTGYGRGWFTQPGQSSETGVAGTVIVKKNRVSQTGAGTIKYRVTLYGNDKTLGTWEAQGYEGDEAFMKLTLPGQDEWSVAIQGTYVLERLNVVTDPNAKGKYQITQFDQAQHRINSWVVSSFEVKKGKVYMTLPGMSDSTLCASGTYLIEPIAQ